MYFAHIGVGILILGISISVNQKEYYEGVLKIGEQVNIGNYDVTFERVMQNKKKNWISDTGIFSVSKNNYKFDLNAERRVYIDTQMPSTEAGIKRTFFNHLYIVMGQEQPLGSANRVIRIYYNPFIILIWLGAIIMAFGGFISLFSNIKYKPLKYETH